MSNADAAASTPRREPPWSSSAQIPTFSPLTGYTQTEVCVVGGGIAGLSVAYRLAVAGREVVVLDARPLGSGMTAATTAHLACALDDRFFEVERWRGPTAARLAAESHARAIDCIESIVREERIDCDFERLDGYLFLPPGGEREILEREMAAASRAGVEVEWAERAPLGDFDTGPCLRFLRQGQFHPLRYLAGLARAIVRRGGRIFTDTRADEVQGGDAARVVSGANEVRCRHVVVATQTPWNDRVSIHLQQAPYMTYAIGARVPAGSFTRGLFWDTEDPYHYIRLASLPAGNGKSGGDTELLIVGGEDHKTGQADDGLERQAKLEAWARERFPTMGEVEHAWGGEVMETMDGLGLIGRNPWDEDNVYVVSGDSGMGMTHGTLAGMVIPDLILGRDNAWAGLYDPGRVPVKAAAEYVKESANAVAQYTDWLTGGDVGSPEEIERDTGAVLRQGLGKVAVYRDPEGRLHARSAVCPHLGCIVAWNPAERSWDCPCHGSRFDRFGKVTNGPANGDLPTVHL